MTDKDYTGERYNRLTAVKYSHTKEYTRAGRSAKTKVYYWEFKCDCGETAVLSIASVISGGSKSCGCWRREASKQNNTVHGQAGRDGQSRLYRIWAQMKRRCDLPTTEAYENYGGRGISVCNEWSNSFQAFEKWALANGYSDELTIDRRENDGNYEPGNCRWATYKEQANNRRPARR